MTCEAVQNVGGAHIDGSDLQGRKKWTKDGSVQDGAVHNLNGAYDVEIFGILREQLVDGSEVVSKSEFEL